MCGTEQRTISAARTTSIVGKETAATVNSARPTPACAVLRPDGLYQSQQRFGLYRWHIMDPIRFEQDLRVTIQALGWCKRGYLPLQDDIASTVFWYQTLPTAPFPALPDRIGLEVI